MVIAPLSPIDPDDEGRLDYDLQLFGWDDDIDNFFDGALVT